jgi:hypothetical protein
VKDGEEKRRRLAAAGCGTGKNVPSRQCRRDGVGLDWRRADETKLLEAFEKARMKLQTAEWHNDSFFEKPHRRLGLPGANGQLFGSAMGMVCIGCDAAGRGEPGVRWHMRASDGSSRCAPADGRD